VPLNFVGIALAIGSVRCRMGLEDLVSKHRDSTYRGGRFDRWVKVKNRQHPAFRRVMEAFGET